MARSRKRPPATTWPADQVERWALDRIKPSSRNARTHSRKQVAEIAASMREFGFTMPLLVDPAGDLIAGHGRLAAARQLKYRDVPVMVAAGWTEAQIRAYRIADNKLALNAGWDLTTLAGELRSLEEMGVADALLGFGPDERAELLQTEPAGQESKGLGQPLVEYLIVFDDEAQRQAWFDFMRGLRTRFPDAETVGERLSSWLAEHL